MWARVSARVEHDGCGLDRHHTAASRLSRENSMKKILAIALFATTLSAGAASAMPLSPLPAAGSADVIQVAQGCGPGWARGPMGGCRPMYRAPVVVVRPRGCPPRFVWRYGRCRPF
jgi:hypothetical protein